MSAAPPISRTNPSFLRFPIFSNRTGFKPFYIPLILVVPFSRDKNGFQLSNSGVSNLCYYIVNAPNPALVAGPNHVGLLVPSVNEFILNISNQQLLDTKINVQGFQYLDANGKPIDNISEGDFFQYTLIRGNTTSIIPFYPDADYFDLSIFIIDVEDLPRPNKYLFIWQCQFLERITPQADFNTSINSTCISDTVSMARFQLLVSHPGDIHEEMFNKTPSLYFNNNTIKLSDDPLLELYRPFADVLQDVYDEQSLINGINFIDKIPAQLISYLAFLIGWDLPNYPGVTDNVRRAILKQATRLQKLRGSRQAISELFNIFGFTIQIDNLWYSSDGLKLLGVGDIDGTDSITSTQTCKLEPLLFDYSTSGWAKKEIPLLFNPINEIQIYTFLVDTTSQAYQTLLSNGDITSPECQISLDNTLINPDWVGELLADNSLSYTKLILNTSNNTIISNDFNGIDSPLINPIGIKFNNTENTISFTLDHYIQYSPTQKLFSFAVYSYNKIIIPQQLNNLRSNKFAVNILLKNGQAPTPTVLEFLMNFIYKLKAFHSLLYKIAYTLPFDVVYNVTDYCTSEIQTICGPQQTISNITLIKDIIAGLLEEYTAWKNLDGMCNNVSKEFLNIPPTLPVGDSCQFTQYGQDRVISSGGCNPTTEKYCDTIPISTALSNCFKGRVDESIKVRRILPLSEIVRSIPCGLSVGSGAYWLYPSNAKTLMLDGFGRIKGQNQGFLAKQAIEYGRPKHFSLHYSNSQYLTKEQLKYNNFLAYRRLSLEIQKTNMDFPGHRYITMFALENDFTSEWMAKPWDNPNNDLDAQLLTATNGDTYLSYNEVPLIYKGNGLIPDISSFGRHDNRDFQVTHKIYVRNGVSNPAIVEDERIVNTDLESITPNSPIFDSYNKSCGQDFIDGYPAVYGRQSFDYTDLGSDPYIKDIGLPTDSTFGEPTSYLFTFGSMILIDKNDKFYNRKAYRLDCCCSEYGCGSDITSEPPRLNINTCNSDNYLLPNGEYDFSMDHLDIDQSIILVENIGCGSILLDGSIPNFISTCKNSLECNSSIVNGSVNYQDAYNVIYTGSWTLSNNILTINLITQSPNVYGQDAQGYVENGRVFRRGIITTSEQVIDVLTNQTISEKSSDVIGFFQINTKCGDLNFTDNFCYHLNNSMQDEVDINTTFGPHWSGIDDDIVWPELEFDSAGHVITSLGSSIDVFKFVDVW